jgi:hypothetical protein
VLFILYCPFCDKIKNRVNRRDNQEWTTHRQWQHRIHKTQDKIKTRVNRRDNKEWTTQRHWQHRWLSLLFTLFFILSSVLCIRCCHCLVCPMLPVSLCCSFLIFPPVYSSLYFVLCLVYPMLPVSLWTQDKINTRVNRRDKEEWTTQRHWQHRSNKTQDKINTIVHRRVK